MAEKKVDNELKEVRYHHPKSQSDDCCSVFLMCIVSRRVQEDTTRNCTQLGWETERNSRQVGQSTYDNI